MNMWVGTRSAWHSKQQYVRYYTRCALIIEPMEGFTPAVQTLKQRVFKQYVLRKYFRDLQMVVDVKTVCVISVKEEAVLVREVTIIEQEL